MDIAIENPIQIIANIPIDMSCSLKFRSKEKEIMDDLELSGAELEETLRKIESVNQYLGGTSSVLNGLKSIRTEFSKEVFRIVDMGCGSGDILQAIHTWLGKEKIEAELIGLDANPNIVKLAERESHTGVAFKQADVFAYNVKNSRQTIVLCSLFLHHFEDSEIIELFQKWRREGASHVIVNDLHRSGISIFFFRLIAWLWRFPHMAKYDGELSIRRGFRRSELIELAHKAGYSDVSIRWAWAYRYKMILRK